RWARQVELLDNRNLNICVGTFKGSDSEKTRRAVEAAVLRTLYNGGLGGRLGNDKSVWEFRALAAFDIDGILPENLRDKRSAAKLHSPGRGEPASPAAQATADVQEAIRRVLKENRLVLAPNTVFETSFYETTPSIFAGSGG